VGYLFCRQGEEGGFTPLFLGGGGSKSTTLLRGWVALLFSTRGGGRGEGRGAGGG